MESSHARPRRARRPLGFALVLVVATGLTAAPVSAANPGSLFSGNLVVNGDAEAGAGSPSAEGGVVPVPGWTTTGNFTVVEYETQSGVPDSFPTVDGPGPAARGVNFFVGGPDNASSSASQAINVAAAARLIDIGFVRYALAGWLGGFAGQDDNAVVSATFVRGNGTVVGEAAIGPVSSTNRDGVTGLLPRSAFGTVPGGTRQIVFFYNDGYADEISLQLASLVGSNVVVNGGAELGDSSGDFSAVVPAPGWTTTGNATVGPYDDDGFPASTDPGPPSRGSNLFIGGPVNDASTFSQDIDVTAAHRLIDAGVLSYNLSAYLGGWREQSDSATVTVIFRDADGQSLGADVLGPVSAADRGGVTGLLHRQSTGDVPGGTRSVTVELTMNRDAPPEFTYNDGSIDEVRLVLTP
jgi:hypothetical protein